jgi:hypothetical protein
LCESKSLSGARLLGFTGDVSSSIGFSAL